MQHHCAFSGSRLKRIRHSFGHFLVAAGVTVRANERSAAVTRRRCAVHHTGSPTRAHQAKARYRRGAGRFEVHLDAGPEPLAFAIFARIISLAVLIDADNAQAAVIEGLLADIARFGEATVKRIYGDFTAPTSASWKKVLQKYAIKPVQQFAYIRSGKWRPQQ